MSAGRYDAVVVGGGPAGLTAALYLARSRRRTLVLDGGRPRNARAASAHGVFTRDGTPPLELLAEARRQLGEYPEAEFRVDEAVTARGRRGRFVVTLESGRTVEARRLLVAAGVRDRPPPIAGVAELWGTRVHPCAYCHGYEVRDQPLALLAQGGAALAATATLLGLSRDILVCTNGAAIDAGDRARLQAHGARVIEARLSRVEDGGDSIVLAFDDGGRIARAALFLRSEPQLGCDLPLQLGCRLAGPASVAVSPTWETSVPGVYAAGDLAADKKFVAVAAASGAEAALAIAGDLAQEDFGGRWAGPPCGTSAPDAPDEAILRAVRR